MKCAVCGKSSRVTFIIHVHGKKYRYCVEHWMDMIEISK